MKEFVSQLTVLLISFVLLSGMITVGMGVLATAINKAFSININRFKLLAAIVVGVLAVFSFNLGALATMGVENETAFEMFHIVDLALTALLVAGGAQAFHKLENFVKGLLVRE